ncbi:hypothetical protein B6E66_22480 [Streptomyces maremycinicus]|nr:hypothetical protein B6E66_22480 [Streptomyces sp. B9173]
MFFRCLGRRQGCPRPADAECPPWRVRDLIREDTPARFSFHGLNRDCTRARLAEEAGAAA